jgi:cation:H+ antiporter
MLVYFGIIRLIQANQMTPSEPPTEAQLPKSLPSLGRALLGFGISAGVLIVVTPFMVGSSATIAEITGLGTTFIGTTLVALVTSLPEAVTTITAARFGADDMAISNLFGSNLFNMFAIGLTDVFYLQGRFLSVIDPAFVLVGMLGLIMTGMALIGNLARLERRVLFIEVDALLLILTYFAGLWYLYSRGVSP